MSTLKVRRRNTSNVVRLRPDDVPNAVKRRQEIAAASSEKVSVIITPEKVRSDESYVLMFASNLMAVLMSESGSQLTRTDILVWLAYVEIITWGNIVSVPQRAISKRIGATPASVSRAVKKLLAVGLMVRCDGVLHINLSVVLRGRVSSMRDAYQRQALESMRVMSRLFGDDVTPPVALAFQSDCDDE